MPQANDNYFQLFDIEQGFEVELESLEEKYHRLQTQLHPDRFADGSEAERLHAVQMSSYLNQAYNTLKDPLQRAAYLLKLQGRDTETAAQEEMGMDLIMEQMELRESLESLPADESAMPQLAVMKDQVKLKLAARQQDFASAIAGAEIDLAKRHFHEMQFLSKLIAEIHQGEEARLGY